MDKKAWIVVTLCTLGMVWYMFDYAPKIARQQAEIRKAQEEEEAKKLAAEEATKEKKDPSVVGEGDGTTPPVEPVVEPVEPAVPEVPAEKIVMKTMGEDGEAIAVFTFTNVGGGIESVEMLDHFTAYDEAKPIVLNSYAKGPIGALSRGIEEIEDQVYQVVEQTDTSITFETTTKELLKFRKVYTLLPPEEPGAAYRVNLEMTITNTDVKRYSIPDFYLYAGAIAALKPHEFMQPDYTSFLYKNGSKERNRDVKYFRKKDKKINYNPETEELYWGGPMNQYFVHNICASEPYSTKVWAKRFPVVLSGYSEEESEEHYAVHSGIGLPSLSLDGGASSTQTYEIYIGPKVLKDLKAMGKDRVEIMRYNIVPVLGGMAAPVSKFLMSALLWIQGLVHNFGVAILIMTVLLRTAMWPVYAKSQKTMKRMSKLSPKMTALKAKYKDDPRKMQQETAKLFRENGMGPMGPLGGCLPMLIQIPVFLGFFQMLRLAVELRHEPFTAWVTDLSMPDTLFTVPLLGLPFNVLPILMAVTMIWQMRITPKSADPMQQKLMMIMPIIFLVFCYNFASALALYWTGQNIFSIGQTYLTRNQEPEELEKKEEPTPQEIAKKRVASGAARTGGGKTKKKKKK